MTLRDASKLLALEEQLIINKNYKRIVGTSVDMRKVYHMIDRLKDTDCTVLITGESGTGKELVAEALHHSSRRKQKSFVKINCAALSYTLLESDLFGHVKGAFTGADSVKVGRLKWLRGERPCLMRLATFPKISSLSSFVFSTIRNTSGSVIPSRIPLTSGSSRPPMLTLLGRLGRKLPPGPLSPS